jgi:hypothetical protein
VIEPTASELPLKARLWAANSKIGAGINFIATASGICGSA